jgi:hypothetical protein
MIGGQDLTGNIVKPKIYNDIYRGAKTIGATKD